MAKQFGVSQMEVSARFLTFDSHIYTQLIFYRFNHFNPNADQEVGSRLFWSISCLQIQLAMQSQPSLTWGYFLISKRGFRQRKQTVLSIIVLDENVLSSIDTLLLEP